METATVTDLETEKPMTKKQANYFAMHEAQVSKNLKDAARRGDFADVDDLLYDYGRYLERNPEALSVVN